MREYALMLRDYCYFVCLPVASAERGRRVPMIDDQILAAGDHDFTKFGIIPSVVFLIDIPKEICDSWYTGEIFVVLKDSSKPVLFVYSDGGPDHRLTYVSVQLSLICLFLKLDLDCLCVGRTAPYHSWKNPVEHMMSLLNLGLQCVA